MKKLMLSDLKVRIDKTLDKYGDMPVVEDNDYWMAADDPRDGTLAVGIPEDAAENSPYKDKLCFLLLVGC